MWMQMPVGRECIVVGSVHIGGIDSQLASERVYIPVGHRRVGSSEIVELHLLLTIISAGYPCLSTLIKSRGQSLNVNL